MEQKTCSVIRVDYDDNGDIKVIGSEEKNVINPTTNVENCVDENCGKITDMNDEEMNDTEEIDDDDDENCPMISV